MQLLDKGLQDEAMKVAEEIRCSNRCIKILGELLNLKGVDWNKILKDVKDLIDGYERAVNATENFEAILNMLRSTEIEIIVDAGFARGLEYYTGMIFEVYVPELGVALGGGGRYDGLIELFGGEPTPAVGVAMGIDRMMLAMEKRGVTPVEEESIHVLVLPTKDSLRDAALTISSKLRDYGIITEVEVMGRSVSRALSDADRRGITHVVIVGPRELKNGMIALRDMRKKTQKTVRLDELASQIKGKD